MQSQKIAEHNKNRIKEIERGMRSLKINQLEEKRKFEQKIKKQIDEFNKKHNNKYSKLYESLASKMNNLNKNHNCERNNFSTLVNEQKRHGIILSSQMRQQAKDYLTYIKQSKNEIEDTFDNIPNNSKYYSNYVY